MNTDNSHLKSIFFDHADILESLMSTTEMAWWLMELPSGAVHTSTNKHIMLGYDNADDFVHYTNYTDLVHPDDYEASMQAMRDHLEGRAPFYEVDYRIKCKNGEYVTFHDKGKIIQQNGDEIVLGGMVYKALP